MDRDAQHTPEHTEPIEWGTADPTSRRRRSRWRVIGVVAALALVATAVAVGLTERERSTEQVAVAGPDVGEQVDVAAAVDDEASVSALVLDLLDASIPADVRAATVIQHDTDEPTAQQLLESIDEAGRSWSISGTEVAEVSVLGDVAVVHVDLRAGSIAARLASMVLQRVEGTWMVARSTLCGVAQAAQSIGPVLRCSESAALLHHGGQLDAVDLLVGDVGEVVPHERALEVETGWWSSELHRAGGQWWYADYPEEQLGGGGPIGPAELVRVDDDGVETARLALGGSDATVLAGEDLLFVAHSLPQDDEHHWRRELVVLDARSASVLARRDAGASELPVATRGDRLYLLEGTVLHVDRSRDLERIGSVELGTWFEPNQVATVGDELWLTPYDGATGIAVATDLSTRALTTPGGLFAESDGRAWSARQQGPHTVVELIGADEPGSSQVLEHLRAHQVWGDGAGGLWLLGAPSFGDSNGFHGTWMAVGTRQVAVHLGVDGAVDGTWWLPGAGGDERLVRAGPALGLAGGASVSVVAG